MSERIRHPNVIMISDLHVGDPDSPQLEDFDRDADFKRLLREIIPARAGTPATLVIGGDFIDFPQILPELGRTSPGDEFGTTEEESVGRVQKAIKGHPDVWSALGAFLEDGNQVLLLPGNHDIDLHFPAVLDAIRAAVGNPPPSAFDFVREGRIHEKGIYLEHGNQYSYDNRFDHWSSPILEAPDGRRRLERPWGTLFMDLVYNDIEEYYSFVNKVFPHAVLARLLLRRDFKGSWRPLARLVAFFVTKGKRFMLEQLLGSGGPDGERTSREEIEAFVASSLSDLPEPERRDLINEVAKLTGAEGVTPHDQEDLNAPVQGLLGRTDDRGLNARAIELLRTGTVSVVAFGHTHKPVERAINVGSRNCRIFNTGGWIPTTEVDPETLRSMDELRATRFAHALRYLVIDLADPFASSLETLASSRAAPSSI